MHRNANQADNLSALAVVRNAMQNANGLFNQGKGYAKHVCGLRCLQWKTTAPENGTVVTSLDAWRTKVTRQED
jgi:hypothetical protein